MKKFIIILLIILAFLGLAVVGAKTLWSEKISKLCESNPSLFRFAILQSFCAEVKTSSVQKCNFETHTCETFIPQKDSGNFKITVTVDGKPGKGMEIDLWLKLSPGGDSLVINTDAMGVALFEEIPPGTYYPSTNMTNFPKEFGSAYMNWTSQNVEVIQGKTTEMKMDLHSTP